MLTIIVFINNGVNYDLSILLLSYFIIIYCLIKLFFFNPQPFSLHNIFHLFFIFFFGIAPVIQFKKNIIFWEEKSSITSDDFFWGNVLVIVIMIFYNIIYYINKKNEYISILFFLNKNKNSFSKENNFQKGLILISISTTILVFFNKGFILESMIYRGYESANIGSNLGLYFSKIINYFRIIPVICLLFFKLSNKKNNIFELLLLAIVIFNNFPTGIPRFLVATVYIPLAITYFKLLKKQFYFTIGFITSLLFVFPYLHHFRYKLSFRNNDFLNFDMFTKLHFDSYQNTLNVINTNLITYGNQLAGVVFFFIPKFLWEDKPVGSGHVLAEKIEYVGFTNRAISLFGEGYINFGYLGIIFFTIILALFNSSMDSLYWKHNIKLKAISIFYLFMIPLEFYLLRGGLQASISNIIALLFLMFSVVIASKIFLKISKNKQNS